MRPFIHVRTGGSPREMGVDFGRASKDIIREFLDESARFYRTHAGKTLEFARSYALRNFLPAVRERYPRFLDEIRGIAEGAKVAVEDVFFLTADEELAELWGSKKEKCSSAAVSTRRGMFLLHNEDYPPRYHGRMVVCEAEPDGAPAFLALTYPYMLAGPACGFNSAGIAFAVDALNYPVRRRGLLSNYVQRALYEARWPEDVRRIVDAPEVLASFAVTVAVDATDAAVTHEVTPDGIDALRMGDAGFLGHTNHVLSPHLDREKETSSFGSRVRYAALEHLLLAKAREAGPGYLKNVLSSREHGLLQKTRMAHESTTIASAVIDLRRQVMHVARRGPKGHDFTPYRLKSRRSRG